MNVPAIQSFEELTLPFENLPANERALLKRAYEFAYRVHDGQKRASGEAYVVHCIEVARILTDLSLDATVVAAGLLHDVLEDTPVTLAELEEQFGEDIANLVASVSKMDQITLGQENTPRGKPRDREAEFLRKTLLAMTDDIRVILIKLADRLHNMRTLGHLSRERQVR